MNKQLLEFIGQTLRPIELRLLIKFLFRITRKNIRLPDGRIYQIDPISDLGLKLIKNQAYEPKMAQIIENLLEKGDTFIDLGSNEGYFTVLAGKLCGAEGKVFAIEPQKRLWNVIDTNIFLNELTNFHLLPYGIGAKKEELVLQLYPSTNTGASSFSKTLNFKISFSWIRKKIYGTQTAKILTLDGLSPSLPQSIKLIKIDIEGFELEALKGASKILKEQLILNFLVETHAEALKGMGQSVADIDELFKQNGYHKRQVDYNLNLYTLVK